MIDAMYVENNLEFCMKENSIPTTWGPKNIHKLKIVVKQDQVSTKLFKSNNQNKK